MGQHVLAEGVTVHLVTKDAEPSTSHDYVFSAAYTRKAA